MVRRRRRAHARRGLGRPRRRSSGCSSTARRSTRRTCAGARSLDESFLLLFNGHHEDCDVHAAGRRASARRWTVVIDTAQPELDAGRRATLAAGDELRRWSHHSLVAAAARPGMTELRATYRLQLGGGFGFAAARELVPYLRELGVSHLYLPPSFQAREGSTHGYDVVDPASISHELGGEAEFRALADAVREAGLGIVLDIVPNHMAADDANRFWADPRAARAVLRHRPGRPGRHRRFFDVDHLAGVRQEDPEVFAATHELALRLVREGVVDGLRIDHPGRARRPGGLPASGCATAAREHVWVEKILDPGEPLRDWPVDGHGRLRVPQRRRRAVRRPGGRGAADRPVGGGLRRRPALRRVRVRGQARAGADDVRARGRAAACATRRERVAGLERALASLPVYRTYVEPWCGRVEDADRRGRGRGATCRPRWPRVLLLETPGWDAFVTRFQQTTPPVDGQGRRGHRVLPLRAAAGAQRRRRRPGRASRCPSTRLPRRQRERAERFPRNLLVTQTHDTKRSGDVRARIGALAGDAGGVRRRTSAAGWRRAAR